MRYKTNVENELNSLRIAINRLEIQLSRNDGTREQLLNTIEFLKNKLVISNYSYDLNNLDYKTEILIFSSLDVSNSMRSYLQLPNTNSLTLFLLS